MLASHTSLDQYSTNVPIRSCAIFGLTRLPRLNRVASAESRFDPTDLIRHMNLNLMRLRSVTNEPPQHRCGGGCDRGVAFWHPL